MVANRTHSTIGLVFGSPFSVTEHIHFVFIVYRFLTMHAFIIGGVPDAVLIAFSLIGPFNLFEHELLILTTVWARYVVLFLRVSLFESGPDIAIFDCWS